MATAPQQIVSSPVTFTGKGYTDRIVTGHTYNVCDIDHTKGERSLAPWSCLGFLAYDQIGEFRARALATIPWLNMSGDILIGLPMTWVFPPSLNTCLKYHGVLLS